MANFKLTQTQKKELKDFNWRELKDFYRINIFSDDPGFTDIISILGLDAEDLPDGISLGVVSFKKLEQ